MSSSSSSSSTTTSSSFFEMNTTLASSDDGPALRSGSGAAAPERTPSNSTSSSSGEEMMFNLSLGGDMIVDGRSDRGLAIAEKVVVGGSTAGIRNSTASPPPPEYRADALAREALAHRYFYNDDEEMAESRRKRREAAFGPTMTVDDVRREYYMTEKGGGSTKLMQLTSGTKARFEAYFAAAKTAEEILHSRSFAIGKVGEYKRYSTAGAVDLPALDQLFFGYPPPLRRISPEGTDPTNTRSNQICIVTGSSGSGKTFFCLQYLADFLRGGDELSVTVYLAPPTRLVKDAKKDNGTAVGERAVKEIREKLKNAIGRPVEDRLKMRVCVIFDEAGDLDLKGMFDSKVVLDDLYAYLNDHLAENVVMVVAGTGITGGELNSSTDAFFFRLKPWRSDDLEKILATRKLALHLKRGEVVRTVVDAIVAHPKLNALTTNARSASFLVEAIGLMGSNSSYVRDSWSGTLDLWAPALVGRVVDAYMANNGIRGLDADQRPLVAACVFRALNEVGVEKTDLPRFPLLAKKSKAVAIALLTYNVEQVGGASDRQLKLLEGESYAVSVTPAIAIVLFYMAGLQVSLVPGWRAEEEVAGLYAARRLILDCLERHLKVGNSSDVTSLKQELAGIRFVALRRQVQSPRAVRGRERDADEGRIYIPLVPRMTVFLNGEKAKFADVIAPYMLLQAMHTSDGVLRVNIEDELHKCCLLKTSKDDRVLRGVLAVWRGKLTGRNRAPKHDVEALRCYQESSAYPENLVKYGTPVDPVSYGTIESFAKHISWDGDKQLSLPSFLPHECVTFVLVTNAEVIHLGPKGLKISEATLDGGLRLDVNRMGVGQKRWWKNVLGKVKPGVVIEFLFTKSSA